MTAITFYGFGEAGQAFTSGLSREHREALCAYDLRSAALADAAKTLGAVMHDNPQAALQGAEVVFCLVTADQAVAAASVAAPFLQKGTLWLDGNSCSPGSKRKAATIIEENGGRYVDVAIMAPVHPRLLATPCLLGGPHATDVHETLSNLGMQVKVMGDKIGDASAIKMLRSVMIKGLEALTAECILAARQAGVEDKVLASLQASDPGIDWRQRSAYNLERMMVHGKRRAAEMREVAVTLSELGLPNRMAAATALWHDEIAALQLAGGDAILDERADRILSQLT